MAGMKGFTYPKKKFISYNFKKFADIYNNHPENQKSFFRN
jgi:hypothetical protein